VKVGLYARVSTERQQERGTVGSQLEALRAAARADGDEVIEEFVDDGYSGARLDRPALDRLRDAAEAGVLDGVLCLCVDRLARAYAYQVVILEEFERFDVKVRFLEGPAPGDDPQATLLLQMQGVIAEYEKAKIAERYRRGKLYRARAGEIPFWKCSYGHRRVVPAGGGPSRIEIFEPEAQVVREIFWLYVEWGLSVRQIAFWLRDRGIPSPSGKPQCGTSTLDRLLRNEAYIGTVTTTDMSGSRAQSVAARLALVSVRARSGSRSRCRRSSIVTRLVVSARSAMRTGGLVRGAPRRTRGFLRGLVQCGSCHVSCNWYWLHAQEWQSVPLLRVS
jgi:site-specific DNA recombinase